MADIYESYHTSLAIDGSGLCTRDRAGFEASTAALMGETEAKEPRLFDVRKSLIHCR